MAEQPSSINPWVRADLERFNPETLALIPDGMKAEYARVMQCLAHSKAVANIALENVHIYEQERHDFFDLVVGQPQDDNVISLDQYRQQHLPEDAA